MQDNLNEQEFSKRDSNRNFSLSRSQKIMAGLLAFFALFVIVLWSVQFKQTLTEPFKYKGKDDGSGAYGDGSQSLADLQNKDTDKDGLSDYDELQIHKTSPYLEDSDSDGVTDKEEIDKGQDPNCPLGQNCFAGTDSGAGNAGGQAGQGASAGNSTLDMLNKLQGGGEITDLSGDEQDVLKSLVGENMDAATLRQLLLEQGMDKATLDKISDEVLMKSFQEILNTSSP